MSVAADALVHYGPDTSGCGGRCLIELIRSRAYELFEARGRHPNHELDDWLQAEGEIAKHLGFQRSCT